MPVLNERSFLVLVWMPAFVGLQITGFAIVLALDPAGFDACDPSASSGPRPVQAGIACLAVGASVALAIWRLRGWRLLAALAPTALAVQVWLWLLGDSQSC